MPKFPEALKLKLQAAVRDFPKAPGNLTPASICDPLQCAMMVEIPYADAAAKARFQSVMRDQRRMLDSDTDLAGIADRIAENTIKVATIRAISRAPAKPEVSSDDIEWAGAIIHASVQAVSGGVARYLAGSATEALKKLVLGHITDAGVKGLAKSVLMRKRNVGRAAGYELDGALEWLCQSGEIANIGKRDARGSRGRSGERYQARQFCA
jgi:hypothetical protein